MFTHYVLLCVREEAKTGLPVFFGQCIIKQLLEQVFVISMIITKVLVRGITRCQPWLFWISHKPCDNCLVFMNLFKQNADITKQWILLLISAILFNQKALWVAGLYHRKELVAHSSSQDHS